MTAHEVVEFVTIAACSCGHQVTASSEQRAEELMAEHLATCREAPDGALGRHPSGASLEAGE